MKKAIFFITFLLTLFPLIVLGQSVVITPKTVTYTRPKTNSALKLHFTITYPKVKANSPHLSKKIEDSISYKNVFFFNLQDEINRNEWLEEAEYEVRYNQNYILSIYLSMNGIAAYPTYIGKSSVVDLKSGNRVKAKDVFTNLNVLIAKIRKVQQAEITDSIKEIKNQKDFPDVDTKILFDGVKFQRIHLEDFSVEKAGVNFHFNYSFPRYYYPLEPSGNYYFSWKELKPFIRKNGIFARFIK